MARIRASARRPSRCTKTATDTLSAESRFTAERRGIGSDSGSSTTSLASPRIVVVHGATSARFSRGIAASRESTTTGRRPTSAISHHHTSARAGSAVMKPQPLAATTPGRPIRRAHRSGAGRRRHNSRPPRPLGGELAMPGVRHRRARRPCLLPEPHVHAATARRRPWCSGVCDSCHNYATLDHGVPVSSLAAASKARSASIVCGSCESDSVDSLAATTSAARLT